MIEPDGVNPHLFHQLKVTHCRLILILQAVPVPVDKGIVWPVNKAVVIEILLHPVAQRLAVRRLPYLCGGIGDPFYYIRLPIHHQLPIPGLILNQVYLPLSQAPLYAQYILRGLTLKLIQHPVFEADSFKPARVGNRHVIGDIVIKTVAYADIRIHKLMP